MAFWEVHAPLGGLSLAAASRGQEGWGGGRGLAKGMGSCGSGDDGGPVGVGTPLPLHGHVKVAFCKETPEGVRSGGWHSSGEKLRRKGCAQDWYRYESAAPERAGRRRKTMTNATCILGIKAEICRGLQLKSGHAKA